MLDVHSLSSRFALRYPCGFAVHVAHPIRSIQRWTLGRLVPKKIPPPTPEGREGRLFPPEQSSKTVELLNELLAARNKIL
jgi:hypothetical protein